MLNKGCQKVHKYKTFLDMFTIFYIVSFIQTSAPKYYLGKCPNKP